MRIEYVRTDRAGHTFRDADSGRLYTVFFEVSGGRRGGRLECRPLEEQEPIPWLELLVALPRHAFAGVVYVAAVRYKTQAERSDGHRRSGDIAPDHFRAQAEDMVVLDAALLLTDRGIPTGLHAALLLDRLPVRDAFEKADAVLALDVER